MEAAQIVAAIICLQARLQNHIFREKPTIVRELVDFS